MRVIPGYKLLTCLHKGVLSAIYRAIRIADQYPVVIKVNRGKLLTEKIIQRFQREFDMGKQFDSAHVVRYLELIQSENYGIALVMEDDKLVELTSIIPSGGFSSKEFLEIAIQIVESLQAVHSIDVTHNHLKTSHILIQPNTRIIKFIDFNRAFTAQQQIQLDMPKVLSGLAYISPEQTGRINRSIDYRTDFYSLGIIFYQLLCDQLPFMAEDPLGFIHQHLAKQPQSPNQCKPTVALALSKLVMKLLEKDTENRYQSCEGILHDLTYCLANLNENNIIPEFELGLQDFSSKLTLSQHLYGRENEIKILENTLDCISSGKRKVLMVTGPPGIGKSRLIQEISKPLALKNGFFISGKFDQATKNIAYSALTKAFDNFIKRLLIEDEASIIQWKTRLLTALGTQAQFIIKVIPSLTLLIGEQPILPIEDMNQAKKVFYLAFQEFINVFANAAHPLVIFLDDLQWADDATLELMTHLLQQPKLSHLLWIGAYRDTEVQKIHTEINPFGKTLATLQAAEVNVQTLILEPLQIKNLYLWLADSLRISLINVSPLAELIQQKTDGNPFFVKSFLYSLYNQKLLTFSRQHRWQWDINKICQHPATENVITLMIYQMKKLPEVTQEILHMASCLEHQVALKKLEIVMSASKQAVYSAIEPALISGIMLNCNENLCFIHDRVQEAAYHLINGEENIQMHYKIGKKLQEHLVTQESWLFTVVDQFNKCHSIITNSEERLQILRLNLQASQKFKQNAACAAALNYLHFAQSWVDITTLWQTDYSLAFSLYKELFEMEFYSGNTDVSQRLIAEMQPHLKSCLDKIDIYHLLITQKIIQGHQQEAIMLGQQALQLFSNNLLLNKPAEFIQQKVPLLREKLAKISQENLINAPLVVDPEKQAVFKILADLYSAGYQSGSDLLPVITLMAIDLTLEYGLAPEACSAYAMYGLLLGNEKNYEDGDKYGRLAIQLAKKLQHQVQYCRSKFIYHELVAVWSHPIADAPEIFAKLIQECLACSEVQFAGYCWALKLLTLFAQGILLTKVQEELLASLQFLQSTKPKDVSSVVLGLQRIIANLLGDTINENDFNYNNISEDNFISDCEKSDAGNMTLGLYYIYKIQVLYLYGHFTEVLAHLNLIKERLIYIAGTYELALFNWYSSLTYLAILSTLTKAEEKQIHLQLIIKNQQQMRLWQNSCPENFSHKYLLIEAELARIRNEYDQAESFYDQAIDLAGRHGFIHERALAAELTAQYWLEKRKPLCAQGYLNITFSAYKQWGAKRKLIKLKEKYSDLLYAFAPSSLSHLAINLETTFSSNTLKYLDLSSILKASQTISSEIELSKLLRSIMQIIIENACAQQGAVLLIEAEENIFVQAEATCDGKIAVLKKIPLENWDRGAHTIIQSVKKMHQPVVLDNATTDEQFKSDNYILRTQAKSILCVPVLKQTELKAILYVENNLMSHVFTAERVQTMLILTAQMAIALENANYFVEQMAYTRQLAEQAARIQLAEESLHAVTHDLKLALEASKAGTWNLWIDTHKFTWDEGCHALFGLKPGEFTGTYDAFMMYLHREDRVLVNQNIEHSIKENIPFDMECRVIWRDGSQHIISLLGHVYLDAQNRPLKMAGVCLDVTQRRELEQERFQVLQQMKEEESKRAAEAIEHKIKLEEITDTMCHELRNPLNGLYGSLMLIREEIVELKKLHAKTSTQSEQIAVATIDAFLGRINDQLETTYICAKQLKEIIDDVLDYSKLEHNKIIFLEMPFDLKVLINSVLQMFMQAIKQKNIKIIVDLPDQAIVLKGDESQLKRVIINLLNNAIKFTSNGSIKIKVDKNELSLLETELFFMVEDTGIGIPAGEQLYLFERFSSASRRTGAEYGGSGLGLAISKQLVEKMGGRIWVESEQGNGSKFNFTILCKSLTAEEKAEWQAKLKQEKARENLILESGEIEESGDNKNILIVEDNVVNQKLLISYLKKAGYLYQVASNGLEALQKFNETRFDAILMDIEMPEMNGMEATKSIRNLECRLNYTTPIIGLSGYIGEAYKSRALQAGMNDYLIKPYDKEAIYTVLKKYIGFTEKIISTTCAKEPIALTEIKKRRLSKNKTKRKKFNNEAANRIINNAIKTALGYWKAYGCAFIPEHDQQRAVSLIESVFVDRKIRDNEYIVLEKVIGEFICRQSPWYMCFSRIYTIDTRKDKLLTKIIAIHDEGKITVPGLQA